MLRCLRIARSQHFVKTIRFEGAPLTRRLLSYVCRTQNFNHTKKHIGVRLYARAIHNMAPVPEATERLITENNVMIFSKSFCPFCKKVKEIFDGLNVEYKVHELDLDTENGGHIQQYLLQKTGQKTVPNVFINKKHLGGASDTQSAFDDGRLEEMLATGTEKTYDWDLFVVGGGSGGLSCSKEAAALGKKVAVADFVAPTPIGTAWGLGGTCVNVGCIPKKLMHQAALLGEAFEESKAFGWKTVNEENTEIQATKKHKWEAMTEGVQDHIGSLNWGYRVDLRNKAVKYYNSTAKFKDRHTLELTNKKGATEIVTARNIVLATGGRPIYPDIPGARKFGITSDDIFSLKYSPGKTLFVGASYIALECAGFLHGLGYDVTIMVRSILLRGFDQGIAEIIGEHMKTKGVKFINRAVPTKVEQVEEGIPGKLKVTFTSEDGTESSDVFNTVCFAIGRAPSTLSENVGCDTVGIELDKKNFVKVDEADRTNIRNIYAIGDMASGIPELTPVAIQAGQLLARRLYGGSKLLCDYTNVPTTVFTPLEYGSCGMSEEGAREKFGDENIEVFHSKFTPLEWTVPHLPENECYAKLVVNKADNNRVVGFHYLGPNAGEVAQGFALGIKLGATKADFDNLIGIHPTNAEIFTTLNITKSSGQSIDKSGC